MVPIGGRPILWHIMKLYGHYGLKDFIMCLGYKEDMIKDYFLHYEAMNNDFTMHLGQNDKIEYHDLHSEKDYKVTLASTGASAMTGARVKKVQKYVGNEPFCITYGDGVSDVNIEELLKFHKSHGKIGTVTSVHTQSRFGILGINDGKEVEHFAEKPESEGWISAGFFVFEPEFFDYLTEEDDCTMESSPLQKLAQDGQLMSYEHEGFFFAMDTYRESLKLNELWKENKAPWKVWTD